ncbi:MAG: hypothetical protein KF729_00250 [Sandaracinaceae bacterium]|nr:hypothetical protein [Sandaracinaceae bacterium]
MHLHIVSPCGEDWDHMEAVGRGRHCARCDHVVVDLSRMPRARAEALVRARRGRVCGRLLVDPATGEAWFPPEPSAPPRGGGLALAAALAGAGCSAASAEPDEAVPVAVVEAPLEPAAPLEPVAAAAREPERTSGPVSASELAAGCELDPHDTPTPEQRRLTAAKHARGLPPAAAYPPPHVYPMLGDIAY